MNQNFMQHLLYGFRWHGEDWQDRWPYRFQPIEDEEINWDFQYAYWLHSYNVVPALKRLRAVDATFQVLIDLGSDPFEEDDEEDEDYDPACVILTDYNPMGTGNE